MDAPEGWTKHPVIRCGQEVAFFCTQGAEIHCYRDESAAGNWLTRQDLERLTRPIFAEFGHLLTRVRKSNLEGHRFVTRLGFYPTAEDEQNIYYRAERLKHARL